MIALPRGLWPNVFGSEEAMGLYAAAVDEEPTEDGRFICCGIFGDWLEENGDSEAASWARTGHPVTATFIFRAPPDERDDEIRTANSLYPESGPDERPH